MKIKLLYIFARQYFIYGIVAMISVLWSGNMAYAVFDQAVPNSCIDCHAKLSDKRLSHPVELWAESVHAEVGNTCDGCHGGDPGDPTKKSMSMENNFYAAPEENEIVNYCGKCHRELADNFQTSQHAITETQNCIGCHGSHTIRRISIEIINEETCGECHDYKQAGEMKTLLQSLHEQFHASKEKIKSISGFPTKQIEEDFARNWTKLRQVRMISHTFDVTRIKTEAEKVMTSLNQTDAEVQRLVIMSKKRKVWGAVAIIVFALLALTAWRYNEDYKKG